MKCVPVKDCVAQKEAMYVQLLLIAQHSENGKVQKWTQ